MNLKLNLYVKNVIVSVFLVFQKMYVLMGVNTPVIPVVHKNMFVYLV